MEKSPHKIFGFDIYISNDPQKDALELINRGISCLLMTENTTYLVQTNCKPIPTES